jgi:hypothetical protein
MNCPECKLEMSFVGHIFWCSHDGTIVYGTAETRLVAAPSLVKEVYE